MKKLMIAFAAGLVSALTFAAQCAGTTLDGARCTRKPDEGCRYCAQHRKQPVSAAKKAAPQPKKK